MSTPLTSSAGVVAGCLIGVVVIFQLALAAGAPWGAAAYGGRAALHDGRLPDSVLGIGAWILAGLFALNTLGNLAGRHPAERWGAGGVTAVLTLLCVWIAATR